MNVATRDDRIDIMRGLSILLVLLHHFNIAYPLRDMPLVHAVARNGNYGVTIFFVISGFLVTRNALERWGGLRAIAPASFWLLRLARIVPTLVLTLVLVFAQRARLVSAEQALQKKVTKKAENDLRIATKKIKRALEKLGSLKSVGQQLADSRIFPGTYAPVIVEKSGERLIRPMRYQCRPEGGPAKFDIQYPGTYNARRNNWKGSGEGCSASSTASLLSASSTSTSPSTRSRDGSSRPVKSRRTSFLSSRPSPPRRC